MYCRELLEKGHGTEYLGPAAGLHLKLALVVYPD
jgi:hypothetical protein